MEKFEIDDEKNVEVYSSFVEKAKSTLLSLIENIKGNIKNSEDRIKDTEKDVNENESAREKCEQEIVKMENRISEIKDAIDNVESTYKKIADAYSSTSKGDTKDLYSKIIEDAKANCEEDVEKNRSEIARLNSEIEGVKVDIANYSSTIDELNKDLDEYNLELDKYNKTLEYFEKISDKAETDLEEISNEKAIVKKPESRVAKTSKKTSKTKDTETDDDSNSSRVIKEKPSILETLKNDTYKIPKEEPKKEDASLKTEDEKEKTTEPDFESSLKQIYDLTGYNPQKEEIVTEEKVEEKTVNLTDGFNLDSAPSFDFDFDFDKKEEPKKEEKKVYTDNLESLFSSAPDMESQSNPVEESPFLDSDFSDWENLLNSTDTQMMNKIEDVNSDYSSIDAMLKPYGTSFKRLLGLIGNRVFHIDGSNDPFEMDTKDVENAINAIDGNDLKSMKKVGPEITILRKVKALKEGNL